MKSAIKYLFLIIVPVLATTSCKKDTEDNNTGGETPGGGKPPVENKYNNMVEVKAPVQKGITVNVNNNIGGFQQALPALYDSTTKRYPLLIFIHGKGELGDGSTQLYNAANVGVPRLIKDKKFPPNFTVNSKNYSFIVIAPQIKTWDYKTVAKDINDMLTYAIAKYRIDTTRIYVSGLSMGGGYTWEFAGDYAKRVAAIVPICGASGPNDTRAKNLVNAKVAVWAFHNNDDGVVLPSNSIGYVDKINALNPAIKAKLTLWPTGGHDAWTKATNPTYRENNMNIYEWMLQYSRN